MLYEQIRNFLQQARQFEQKNITSKDPDFVAWNNSLIRYLEKIMASIQVLQQILKIDTTH